MLAVFKFRIAFEGDGTDVAAMFQEVSGLEVASNANERVEGGENRFVHHLPEPSKFSNLKLKRGHLQMNSALMNWCKTTLENDLSKPIDTKDLKISLLDSDGDAVANWVISNAYPVKWELGPFDAMKNEMAIEAIELAHNTITRR